MKLFNTFTVACISGFGLKGTYAQLTKSFPLEGATFDSSSSDSVTFGAIIQPRRNDIRYEVDFRVKGEQVISYTEMRRSDVVENLWLVDIPEFGLFDLEKFEWRVAIYRCGFFWCDYENSEWRNMVVLSSEYTPFNQYTTTIEVTPPDSNVVFALRRTTDESGPIYLFGGAESPVAGVLQAGAYFMRYYGSNDGTIDVRVEIDSVVFYDGPLVQNLEVIVPAPDKGEGGNDTDEEDDEEDDEPANPPSDPMPPSPPTSTSLCDSPDPNKYNICVDLDISDDISNDGFEAFQSAKARWESVISGDIIDWEVDDVLRGDLQGGFAGPLFDSGAIDIIDDLYIYAKVQPIDGPGRILGQAGPTLGEWDNGFLYAKTGTMEFDDADVDLSFRNVILHEMGHVLGIGTLWEFNGLYADPIYSGANANREYRAIRGGNADTRVPIEQDGGPGTADGHWDESCLGDELSTGYLSGAQQPLSRITIGGLEDLGYEVDYSQADPFTIRDIAVSRCLDGNRRRGLQSDPRPLGEAVAPRRQLREELKVEAIRFGLKSLEQKKKAMEGVSLPPGMVDLGSQFTEVIVLDGDNMFAVPVSNTMTVEKDVSNTMTVEKDVKPLP